MSADGERMRDLVPPSWADDWDCAEDQSYFFSGDPLVLEEVDHDDATR